MRMLGTDIVAEGSHLYFSLSLYKTKSQGETSRKD
jgi:hypothetical protein